ncbi:MAG: hypothetical protein ACJ76N_03320 [Thermoanaerobaculia bacterium]
MRVRSLGIVFLVSCLAMPAFAADRVIQNGIDVWTTKGDGSTFIDFAKTPIPAGFFCAGSAPFTGRVVFQGEPIVTGTPKALGATDTIVQRLDDAVFNKQGVAVTRTQVRALSLKSVAPLETGCGKFTATMRLDGVQPVTRMVIRREDENGGRFSGPLWLNVKVSFTPVGRASREALELPVGVRFPAKTEYPWRTKTAAPVPAGFVLVDTDGDRVADTYLPGTSNFIAGQSSKPASNGRPGAQEKYGQYICHDSGTDKQHCTYLCDGCQIP